MKQITSFNRFTGYDAIHFWVISTSFSESRMGFIDWQDFNLTMGRYTRLGECNVDLKYCNVTKVKWGTSTMHPALIQRTRYKVSRCMSIKAKGERLG